MSRIIRYCKSDEEYEGINVFDITRNGIFGNPYTHIKNKETRALVKVRNRDEAIDLYSKYFDEMYLKDKRFKDEFDKMYEAYKKYDEIFLGCYCSLDERCHGDIIEEKLIQRAIKEKLSKIKGHKISAGISEKTDSL